MLWIKVDFVAENICNFVGFFNDLFVNNSKWRMPEIF